ncbi:hypothetical protein CK203_103594 [Vitis vinifera]|uniref:Uncharacterized protein n=1 Tax=Vitis vinifera TaxID=29760 RepID=A0A438CWN6_VITVI|nr:hypothetical protein CK203_103594 [Vitis vinifera]
MERSKTDQALVKEALRYGDDFVSWGRRDSGSSPSHSFSFGRTPMIGEYYDFSRAVGEAVQGEIPLRMVIASGITKGVTTACWDLIKVNNGSNKERRVELCSAQNESQENRGWEESSLARTLEVLDLEVGQYSVSCRFRNVEDGFVWIFMGVYGPFTRKEKECLWKELGAIRGIWEDPWCLGEEQDVREGVANAFHQLLSESSEWKADIEGLQLDHLSLQEAECFELPFFEEEVLANRLKKVIGKVVSLDQNAFVMGGQILDASLIANEVMQKMGFGSKWMGWMWRCISTAKFFVLVNEVPVRIRGRGRTEMNISHLLFANNTVFCEAKKEYLTYLSWTLFWFEATLGLRINLAKSEILPVGGVEEVEELAVELGCRVGSLPSTYLGLPLGAPHKSLSMWDEVEERVRRRLALWKRQYISKGGRITLIKSTMTRGNLERKVHLVKWEVVSADKEKGGLGIRKLALLNKALLGRWIFAFEKENLWKKVISVKYGQEGLGWRTNKTNGTFRVGVWKEILKETNWCWENIGFTVGNGTKIRFWTDHWCGLAALSQSFPQLYALAVQRNARVDEVWDPNFGQGGWNLSFIRAFNDWELDLVGDLLTVLRGYRLTLEEDSVT